MFSFFRYIANAAAFLQLPVSSRCIVFYSEGKAYWPHLESLVKEFLRTTAYSVCYISSAHDDPGLQLSHDNISCFEIDAGWVRNWLFERMEFSVVVMTMPDLNRYQIKKSKKSNHYVYVQHSILSLHMVYRKGAFDYYDSIFCAGPHHLNEIRAMEAAYSIGARNLVEHGYARLDSIIKNRRGAPPESPLHVLVAPTWGERGMIETIGIDIVRYLVERGIRVTLRPHPETVKNSRVILNNICEKYQDCELFDMDMDMAGEESLHASHLMISDWSCAAYDYAFGLMKPVLFIDGDNRKINNLDYMEIDVSPFEVTTREKVGYVMPVCDLPGIAESVIKLINQYKLIQNSINMSDHVFNIGNSHIAGAAALENIADDLFKK